MKQFVDFVMAYMPIILLAIIVGCLIYSEFTGVCISWNGFMRILHKSFFSGGVKVLG